MAWLVPAFSLGFHSSTFYISKQLNSHSKQKSDIISKNFTGKEAVACEVSGQSWAIWGLSQG